LAAVRALVIAAPMAALCREAARVNAILVSAS
jgi:hypothetical protein